MDAPSPKVLIPIALLILGAGAAQYLSDKRETGAADTGGCTPEGGLRCENGQILICEGAKQRPAGVCEGGCTEENGIASCFDVSGTLVAPEGAACRPGMAMCSITGATLLVCEAGVLQKAATCPAGCVDQGNNTGLYCLDERDALRFAAGFACPEFATQTKYACGADSQQVLVCKDGILAEHTTRCEACVQTRQGGITCLDGAGGKLSPATGERLTP